MLELFPETKLGIGPPTESGFYYDFQRDAKFTPEDLERIEAKMAEIAEERNCHSSGSSRRKKKDFAKYADDWMKKRADLGKGGCDFLRIYARS